jgi:hypothetical protein
VAPLLALVALAPPACDHAPSADPPPVEPTRAIAGVDQLTGQLAAGENTSRAEFDRTLAPLRGPLLQTWPEPELEKLVSALLRLKHPLVERFAVTDENGLCSEDSWVIYASCAPGPHCLAAVSLTELRCLWWLSGR